MRLALILLSLLWINAAEAVIDCQTPPKCADLGYSKDNDPNCLKDGYVYCPFDHEYKMCVEHNCESLGFTKTDKTSWCNKLIKCKSDETFTLCKALCEVGDVYYADGTCGYVEDYDGTKTPVGVVYYISDGGQHGKVINLHDLGKQANNQPFDPEKPYETGYNLYWGDYNYDVPDLTNYDKSDAMLNGFKAHDSGLYDGQKNTETIIAHKPTNCSYQSNNSIYYQNCIPQAAQAAHDFYPYSELQNDPKVGKGHWYLPALGELMDLYGYDVDKITVWTGTTGAKGDIKTTVNATLKALKDKSVMAEQLTNSYYWSSSEENSTYSWFLSMSNGYRNGDYKNSNSFYVRVSLQF